VPGFLPEITTALDETVGAMFPRKALANILAHHNPEKPITIAVDDQNVTLMQDTLSIKFTSTKGLKGKITLE